MPARPVLVQFPSGRHSEKGPDAAVAENGPQRDRGAKGNTSRLPARHGRIPALSEWSVIRPESVGAVASFANPITTHTDGNLGRSR